MLNNMPNTVSHTDKIRETYILHIPGIVYNIPTQKTSRYLDKMTISDPQSLFSESRLSEFPVSQYRTGMCFLTSTQRLGL